MGVQLTPIWRAECEHNFTHTKIKLAVQLHLNNIVQLQQGTLFQCFSISTLAKQNACCKARTENTCSWLVSVSSNAYVILVSALLLFQMCFFTLSILRTD